jgi:hypothetical protein
MQNRMKLANLLGLAAVAGLMALSSRPASSQLFTQFLVDDGNFGGGSGGNVLAASTASGMTLVAMLNGSSSLGNFVNVTSNETISGTGGQAKFDAADGSVNNICFSLGNNAAQANTYYFSKFSLDPQGITNKNAADKTYNIEVHWIDFMGNTGTQTVAGWPAGDLGPGENRFGVTANAGFALTEVCFLSANGADNIKQARILGVSADLPQPPTGNPVPEPGVMAMGLGTVVPVLGLIRRKRNA